MCFHDHQVLQLYCALGQVHHALIDLDIAILFARKRDALALDAGVRPDVGIGDEVVDDATPRVVMRQVIVILGSDLLHL